MPTVRIVDPGDVTWVGPDDGGQRGQLIEVPAGHDGLAGNFRHPGSETELSLHEVRTPPNHEILPHAHLSDEIIYVTSGEMHMGARVLGVGSSVYIPANTLYGFSAGPEGLTFLNFRAAADSSHIMKDDFIAARATARDVQMADQA